MKIRYFCFTVTFLICLVVESQDIGFNSGLNYSTQSFKNLNRDIGSELGYNSIVGFRLGIDYKPRLVKNLFFLTGINFNQKGYSRSGKKEGAITSRALKEKLYYLEVPISFLIMSEEKMNTPYLTMGFYSSYLVGGNISLTDEDDEPTHDVLYYNRKLDIGLSLGTGFKFGQFALGLITDFGLSNLYSGYGKNFKRKNKNLGIIFRYWPRLKREKKS